MTKLNIDRVGDSYAVDYSAECVEFLGVQEIIDVQIIDVLSNFYYRQGLTKTGEGFVVSKVELHVQFKVRE